jgi:hypothetical protein
MAPTGLRTIMRGACFERGCPRQLPCRRVNAPSEAYDVRHEKWRFQKQERLRNGAAWNVPLARRRGTDGRVERPVGTTPRNRFLGWTWQEHRGAGHRECLSSRCRRLAELLRWHSIGGRTRRWKCGPSWRLDVEGRGWGGWGELCPVVSSVRRGYPRRRSGILRKEMSPCCD